MSKKRRRIEDLLPYQLKWEAQRNMARYRDIDWNLTLDEWVDWWGDDIGRRGKRNDDLVMARIDMKKGYQVDNLLKITHKENVLRGVHSSNGRKRPVRTPLGDFESVTAARKAHGHSNPMTIIGWCKKRYKGQFKYLDEDE
mgnify:CR=1 FL=1|tara:strand:- start:661 stop:1083 length:423 start_codon:yes stop_codon:yes gene_type:complete